MRVLGLDLGAKSVGWALAELKDGRITRIDDVGVRVFDAAVDGDIEQGKEESNAVARRNARLLRRQTKRRAQRMRKAAYILQEAGLLPQGDVRSGASRDAMLAKLDRDLVEAFRSEGADEADLAELPYLLRARALDEELPLHALGRALYHLAQRRGYQTNRKGDKDEKETGKVLGGIKALNDKMNETGARTLGEYFYRMDRSERPRIRQHYTRRDMYKDEFEQVWTAQERFHPDVLTAALKNKLRWAIFYQRPLKSQKGLVGDCELIPGKKRAPKALLAAQRFRLLQRLNDLQILFPLPQGGQRGLNEDERAAALALLERSGKAPFSKLRTAVRKIEKLPKDIAFNLEEGGEKAIVGDSTSERVSKAIGKHWDDLSQSDRQDMVGLLMSNAKPATIKRHGLRRWGLDDESADKLSKVHLEEGYISLSREAIARLLPLMEGGMPFKTAEKEVFGGTYVQNVCDRLPPLEETTMGIRNPVVTRCLTELRKVVNAVIDKHDKPDVIRIEMARDLKNSRKKRKQMWEDNRKREKERDDARKRIERDTDVGQAKGGDILKVRLADECGWECPYTGKRFGMADIVGPHPQFDVEHIIPYSRCLDDSFVNKTLCYHEYNRHKKKNQTPFECCNRTDPSAEDYYETVLARVGKFAGDAARAKLERFRMEDLDAFDDFSARKLNDTRYASKEARRYLSWLYGDDTNRYIQAGTGQVTALLRNAWNLNSILGDGGRKSRDDHRHHAVDAICIAATTPTIVKELSRAAERQLEQKGRTRGFWKLVETPWDTFLRDAQAAVDGIVVSHRPSRKVMGRLHEDTIYSPPKIGPDGKECVHFRKPIALLSAPDVGKIVDDSVREAVMRKLDELGEKSPAKAFKDEENHPSRNGIPIHSVRLRDNRGTVKVGKGHRARNVWGRGNHHIEIYEVLDEDGNVTKWEGKVVTTLEAVGRVTRLRALKAQRAESLEKGDKEAVAQLDERIAQSPVIQRDHGPNTRFLFSLTQNDIVEVDVSNGDTELVRELYVVRGVTVQGGGMLQCIHVSDARKKADIPTRVRSENKVRAMYYPTMTTLMKDNCRKMQVNAVGSLAPARD